MPEGTTTQRTPYPYDVTRGFPFRVFAGALPGGWWKGDASKDAKEFQDGNDGIVVPRMGGREKPGGGVGRTARKCGSIGVETTDSDVAVRAGNGEVAVGGLFLRLVRFVAVVVVSLGAVADLPSDGKGDTTGAFTGEDVATRRLDLVNENVAPFGMIYVDAVLCPSDDATEDVEGEGVHTGKLDAVLDAGSVRDVAEVKGETAATEVRRGE